MSESAERLLEIAVIRSSAATLSLPSAGMTRSHKSRFLTEDAGGRFWIESVPAERERIAELISTQKPVAISFIAGMQKIHLWAVPLEVRAEFQLSSAVVVPAILVEKPVSMRVTQRRADYRVRVPEDSDLKVRVWRIGEHAVLRDRPMASAEMKVELRDVSHGGLGVILNGEKAGEKARASNDERLRIELVWRDGEAMLFEGRLRIASGPKTESIRVGVKFVQGTNLEARQSHAALHKIVGELQRDEVRRKRMGLAA